MHDDNKNGDVGVWICDGRSLRADLWSPGDSPFNNMCRIRRPFSYLEYSIMEENTMNGSILFAICVSKNISR